MLQKKQDLEAMGDTFTSVVEGMPACVAKAFKEMVKILTGKYATASGKEGTLIVNAIGKCVDSLNQSDQKQKQGSLQWSDSMTSAVGWEWQAKSSLKWTGWKTNGCGKWVLS